MFSFNNGDSLKLNHSEIISVKIKKVNPKSSQLQRELNLKPNQFIEFANHWNNSVKDNSDKIKPEYFIFVTLKNKQVRYFSIAENQIDNGYGEVRSSTGNKEYFDALWKSLCE